MRKFLLLVALATLSFGVEFLDGIIKYEEENKIALACKRKQDPHICQEIARIDTLRSDTGNSGFYQFACEYGSEVACKIWNATLKPFKFDDSETIDLPKEERLSKCLQGHGGACFSYGWYNTERFHEEFFEFMKMSCAFGFQHGCVQAGHHLADTDPEAADQYLIKACNMEESIACYTKAFYRYKFNNPKALDDYKHFCERGDLFYCRKLAVIYDDGEKIVGGKPDKDKAMIYYKKSCDLEEWDSCALLGKLHIGKGDVQKGLDFIKLSCSNENKLGCKYLKEITGAR